MKNKLFLFFLLFAYFPLSAKPLTAFAVQEIKEIHEVLAQGFPGVAQERYTFHPLKGGLSGTSLYRVKTSDSQYVLRIHRSSKITDQDKREHIAFTKAAKEGIAPHIFYASTDHRAIIMEFVDGKTLTLEQAHLPHNCKRLASAIRQIHQSLGPDQLGENILSKAERCYQKVLSDGSGAEEQIQKAFNLLKKYRQELDSYHYEKVGIHGDLNPRNIFLANDRILFIDWSETNFDDPFYDLSYFALKLAYGKPEEDLFLKTYLQRKPTEKELCRYLLQKRIHQAFWSLTNLYLAEVARKKHPGQQVDRDASLKTWEFYQKAFANGSEELSSQYFYDLSRLNYQLALELN